MTSLFIGLGKMGDPMACDRMMIGLAHIDSDEDIHRFVFLDHQQPPIAINEI